MPLFVAPFFCIFFRLGVDLDKTFKNGANPLPDSLIGTLAVQIINTLEYIHSKGYTHNDVKVNMQNSQLSDPKSVLQKARNAEICNSSKLRYLQTMLYLLIFFNICKQISINV